MKRVTSHDVAKLAGVSQATVSYVLNGNTSQSISAETRKRVLDAARQLDYYPNNAAKVLKNEKTLCVDVVVNKNLNHARYGETVQVLRNALEKRGYRIQLTRDISGAGLPGYVRDYLENKVDGVVYVGADGMQLDQAARDAVKAYRMPFVAIDCNEQDSSIAAVDIDYAFGVRAAVDTLAAEGCGTYVYVDPCVSSFQEQSRIEAFKGYAAQIGAAFRLPKLDFSSYLEMEQRQGDDYDDKAIIVNMARDGSIKQLAAGILDMVRQGPRQYGIICPWRAMRDILAIAMLEWPEAPVIVTLAYESDWLPYKGALYSSRLPNKEVSHTAVGMLLAQIEGGAPGAKALLKPGKVCREN